MTKARYIIGIDTGTHTGICVWDTEERQVRLLRCVKIHEAMRIVLCNYNPAEIFVRVEDARKRKWFGSGNTNARLQGAGSVKRDASIWDDFLRDLGVRYEMVAPKDNKTKLTAQQFNLLTKYDKRTNEHERDACMLVFGY